MFRRILTHTLGGVPGLVLLALTIGIASATPPPEAGPPEFVTGRLQVIIGDDWTRGRSDRLLVLEEEGTGRSFDLKFNGGGLDELQSGTRIRVRGRASGRELYLEANGAGDPEYQVLEAASEAATTGDQQTLVVLGEFAGLPLECGAGQVRDIMFSGPAGTTVDGLYREMSEGAVGFGGTVLGTYTIDMNPANCDMTGWANALDGFAQSSVNVSSYTRRVYVLPRKTGCSYAGFANIGGANTRAWVLACHVSDVYGHELGHNLGMGHASTPSNQYGDKSGIMGISGLPLRQANAPHQIQLGWVHSNRIKDVSTSGQHRIAALALDGSQLTDPQVIRVRKADDNTYYYLSLREPIGYDANLSSTYQRKLTVHNYTGSGSSKTYLLATLVDGGSYRDETNGITFTQISYDGNAVTAQIDFDGGGSCTSVAPNVSLSPASQTALPGESRQYSVAVTNRDSQECATTRFDLSSAVPSGWSGTLSASSLNLAPGASGSATLAVAAASSAGSGDYGFSVSASDAAKAGHSGSADGQMSIAQSCIKASPTVSILPSSQTGAPGETRLYQVVVTNNDSNVCAATTFDMQPEMPVGLSGVIEPRSLSLAPGQKLDAALNVASDPTASAGALVFRLNALDQADPSGHKGSRQATYEVSSPPVGEDSAPPSAPTRLRGRLIDQVTVGLSWRASSDNVSVLGYRIYRDSTLIATTPETSYDDPTFIDGAVYVVTAYDAAGNESEPSNAFRVKQRRGKTR